MRATRGTDEGMTSSGALDDGCFTCTRQVGRGGVPRGGAAYRAAGAKAAGRLFPVAAPGGGRGIVERVWEEARAVEDVRVVPREFETTETVLEAELEERTRTVEKLEPFAATKMVTRTRYVREEPERYERVVHDRKAAYSADRAGLARAGAAEALAASARSAAVRALEEAAAAGPRPLSQCPRDADVAPPARPRA
eukprot:tig00020510_g9939.t1